ncbi:hypothetical protein FHS55_001586 [Angulomicrobium tetraedrale]|uniref:Uncharacterized protein n=1 Tax=Ancylobacter tetraedralis TaxID=217068 RepID=A0A839Z7D1_9HYPH|nr:hypothetical protein [Ancylobacter tetraedralis]MBB3770991.1 hypothetical protein [Ancylobacter tetraedralis]
MHYPVSAHDPRQKSAKSHHEIDRVALVAALQVRLNALYNQCKAFHETTRGKADDDPIFTEWERVAARAERTRKTLIRSVERMPYWKWARIRTAELEAEGWEFVPTKARASPTR